MSTRRNLELSAVPEGKTAAQESSLKLQNGLVLAHAFMRRLQLCFSHQVSCMDKQQ